MMRPSSDRQWQDAVDAAHLMLMLEIARLYNLASSSIEVNIQECEQIISEGRTLGFQPALKAVPALVREVKTLTTTEPEDESHTKVPALRGVARS